MEVLKETRTPTKYMASFLLKMKRKIDISLIWEIVSGMIIDTEKALKSVEIWSTDSGSKPIAWGTDLTNESFEEFKYKCISNNIGADGDFLWDIVYETDYLYCNIEYKGEDTLNLTMEWDKIHIDQLIDLLRSLDGW